MPINSSKERHASLCRIGNSSLGRLAYELSIIESHERFLDVCFRRRVTIPNSCRAGRCGERLGQCLAGGLAKDRSGDFLAAPIGASFVDQGAMLACSVYPVSGMTYIPIVCPASS